MSEYNIIPISKVKVEQLNEFYKKTYPKRYKTLTNNWQWWYNCKNINQHPIVLLHRDDVIGQAAHTPVSLKFNGKKINSQTLKLPSGKTLKGKSREQFEIKKIKTDVLKSELILKLS